MKKEEFKEFVKKNPILISYVKNGNMTWQKFYEIYDLYGEEDEVWKEYLSSNTVSSIASSASALGLFDFVKNLDFDSIQNGVNSMQRVLSLLQDMSKKNNNFKTDEYTARPLYKHFED